MPRSRPWPGMSRPRGWTMPGGEIERPRSRSSPWRSSPVRSIWRARRTTAARSSRTRRGSAETERGPAVSRTPRCCVELRGLEPGRARSGSTWSTRPCSNVNRFRCAPCPPETIPSRSNPTALAKFCHAQPRETSPSQISMPAIFRSVSHGRVWPCHQLRAQRTRPQNMKKWLRQPTTRQMLGTMVGAPFE